MFKCNYFLYKKVLSFVAENERENIKTRQHEGIKAEKERGVRFGRPKLFIRKKFLSAVNAYIFAKQNGEKLTMQRAAAFADMKLSVFHYHLQNFLLQIKS